MTALPPEIRKAAEIAALEFSTYKPKEPYEGLNIPALDQFAGFNKGVEWLWQHLSEGVEFDEKAAHDAAVSLGYGSNSHEKHKIWEAACKWQHDQMAARVALAEQVAKFARKSGEQEASLRAKMEQELDRCQFTYYAKQLMIAEDKLKGLDGYQKMADSNLMRLGEQLTLAMEALEKIASNHNMTIMNDSEEFMDGAHDAYYRQAELANEAILKLKGE